MFEKIPYDALNARQKENYNYHKVSALLADYGFTTLRLSDDWQGADFIAQHIDGQRFLKVQLKGRLYFGKKYLGKDLFISFQEGGHWFLYPHDRLFDEVKEIVKIEQSGAWEKEGDYHFPSVPARIMPILEKYKLGA